MKTYSSGSQYSRSRSYYKKPFRKTKGFYILLVIVLIVAGFIYWSITNTDQENNGDQKYSDQNGAPIMAAKVTFVDGELKLKAKDEPWQEIAADYQVQLNDEIKTGADSKAIIELPDKSIIRIAKNTELKITQMGMADVMIEQTSGTVFHRVNDKSTAIYRVKNGDIEMTALGTAFNVLASSQLTYLTVTENKVKVKIFDGEDIVNMRTIESGTKATINSTQDLDEMIKTTETSLGDLIDDDWYAWNLQKDRDKEFFLGIFEQAVKLVISDPANSEMTVDEDKITIKGHTDPGAEIFMSGHELDNNNGTFETEYLLGPGENEIEIMVKIGKNKNKKTLLITSTKEKMVIDLSGEIDDDNKVTLTWETENIDDTQEFKILKGSSESPTYPDAPYHSVDNKTFTDSWTSLADGEYFFRVCALSSESKCLTYSEDYEVTVGNPEQKDSVSGTMDLSVALNNDQVNLNWSTSTDLNTSEGFKTVISQTENPAFPGNSYHTLTSNERSDIWKNMAPGTYHFRVCLLKNNQCIIYSNDATIEAKPAGSIQLLGSAQKGRIDLTWEISGLEIDKGFKVIMAEQSGVIFPGKTHHLITTAAARADSWVNLETGKTYYFKICKNNGSSCGTYSNEVVVTFQ
ncbi:FecR domain-containing protein [Candidatus Kuenenbacteria bacterium]|nr:FecR domain-containing protein [Candidatus Kuenenbacteria bacterium]